MSSPIARPLEAAPATALRSLPAWVYHHPEMTRLECERILRPSWQIACHVSQIPRAGDYVTFELGGDSVIVLREPGGAIRSLRNVCRHRGTRLLEGSGHCPGRITCPYHGWTYRYDGSLLATPARDTFPDLELREHGLGAVRVEVALGFVWVCLADDTPPPPSQTCKGGCPASPKTPKPPSSTRTAAASTPTSTPPSPPSMRRSFP